MFTKNLKTSLRDCTSSERRTDFFTQFTIRLFVLRAASMCRVPEICCRCTTQSVCVILLYRSPSISVNAMARSVGTRSEALDTGRRPLVVPDGDRRGGL